MKACVVLAALLVFAVPAAATTSRILAPMDWWPVWSPDGAHVAFTRVYPNHLELDSVDAGTRRIVRIGTNAGQLDPTWSSDGTQLAYSSGGILWIIAANGSGKRRYAAPARAFAPAWRPASTQLAYLTTHLAQNTDLWVAGTLWARNAIGKPSWSPDGAQLAFQRDDGIYATSGPGDERKLATVANPGAPAWSPDGSTIAFTASSRMLAVPADGSTPARALATGMKNPSTPSWSRQGDSVAYTRSGAVEITYVDGHSSLLLATSGGVGVAFAPNGDFVAFSGPRAACPGHISIRIYYDNAVNGPVTGSCAVTGTSKADEIEGTRREGDIILAGPGNDRIHANDGHTDRVNCGPGRDTVWADRSDRLTDCEIVHRSS
jgi:Tol biopolymer transport system component